MDIGKLGFVWGDVFFAFKSSLNHHLGEYFRFFVKHLKQIQIKEDVPTRWAPTTYKSYKWSYGVPINGMHNPASRS